MVQSDCDRGGGQLEALERREEGDQLHAAMSRLPARERQALEWFYGLEPLAEDQTGGATLRDIAAALGVSHEWARQLIARAIGRLREDMGVILGDA